MVSTKRALRCGVDDSRANAPLLSDERYTRYPRRSPAATGRQFSDIRPVSAEDRIESGTSGGVRSGTSASANVDGSLSRPGPYTAVIRYQFKRRLGRPGSRNSRCEAD